MNDDDDDNNNNNNSHWQPQLAPRLRWRRPENKPSTGTPRCQGRTCSSRLFWKLRAINESVVQLLNDLGHKITSVSADDKDDNFSFRDSLSLRRDSTPSCCTSILEVTSTRTFSRPAFSTCLAFNPRDLYYRGY